MKAHDRLMEDRRPVARSGAGRDRLKSSSRSAKEVLLRQVLRNCCGGIPRHLSEVGDGSMDFSSMVVMVGMELG